jgi:sigma-B regulation protein RsbU (phosphoserine phosphatase)
MSSIFPRRQFLSGFNLLRFELILLFISVAVRILYWVFHVHARMSSALLYTFIAGNISLLLILLCGPLFERRPRPWNWIGYILVLAFASAVADFAAEIPTYYLFVSKTISFQHDLVEGLPITFILTFIIGILLYAFDDAQARLKASNRQLQSQVQLGLSEKRTHQSDLQQAHDIQVHLLPRHTPQLSGFQIASAWQPARSVSGDYFDGIVLGKDKLGLCIADVSGKGMAAALLMANLQASVKAFTNADAGVTAESPAALCAKLNVVLCDNIAPGRFVTFFYGILDATTRKFKYENAGHCLPLLVHADNTIDFPAAYSGVLGLFSHWTYSDREIQLIPGDVLLLVTDGVLEAWNDKEEEFGYQRLIASVLASRDEGVNGIRKRVLEDVTTFCANEFQDDASLIIVTVD